MRLRIVWLALVLLVTLGLVGVGGGSAQPPGKKKGPPDKFGKKGGFGKGFGAGLSVDQIVQRIMAFDKDNDGKVTREELPERMQHLLALGDTNKDGALDRDEIRQLATALESFVGLTGPGGFGPKGPPAPGRFALEVSAQRALDELTVTGSTREKA